MRILFVTNYYPPLEVGGYEQLCRDVAERLSERGHEVAVLTSDHGTSGVSNGQEKGIFRRLRVQLKFESALGPATTFFLWRHKIVQENLQQLEFVLDKFRPEVAFIWNMQGIPREVAMVCEEREDLAVAYWLAGYSPAEPDIHWRYWEQIPHSTLKRLLKRPLRHTAQKIMIREGKPIRPKMNNVAVVSHYMLEKGLREGTLPHDAEVIYNGVEIEKFFAPVAPRKGDRLRLLQAGRITADKGVHTSLEAARHLVKRGQGAQFELMIAGSGPTSYMDALQEYVDENNLRNNVKFLGRLPREEMPALMAKHDVLLLPTPHQEPFARVVLEGMAAGLAVVASRTGGTEELLQHQVNGVTFEAGDHIGLANQLHLVAADERARQRLAKAGQRKVIEEFSMEIMVDNMEEFLSRVLDQQ